MSNKKIKIVTKDNKTYSANIEEDDNSVTVVYAVNCMSSNYSDSVMNALSNLGLQVTDILSIKYDETNIESYEHGQGHTVKNNLDNRSKYL